MHASIHAHTHIREYTDLHIQTRTRAHITHTHTHSSIFHGVASTLRKQYNEDNQLGIAQVRIHVVWLLGEMTVVNIGYIDTNSDPITTK